MLGAYCRKESAVWRKILTVIISFIAGVRHGQHRNRMGTSYFVSEQSISTSFMMS